MNRKFKLLSILFIICTNLYGAESNKNNGFALDFSRLQYCSLLSKIILNFKDKEICLDKSEIDKLQYYQMDLLKNEPELKITIFFELPVSGFARLSKFKVEISKGKIYTFQPDHAKNSLPSSFPDEYFEYWEANI